MKTPFPPVVTTLQGDYTKHTTTFYHCPGVVLVQHYNLPLSPCHYRTTLQPTTVPMPLQDNTTIYHCPHAITGQHYSLPLSCIQADSCGSTHIGWDGTAKTNDPGAYHRVLAGHLITKMTSLRPIWCHPSLVLDDLPGSRRPPWF